MLEETMKDEKDLNQKINDAGERLVNAGVNWLDGLSKKIDDKAASFYDNDTLSDNHNATNDRIVNLSMKCPSCGASFEPDPEKSIFKCEYCGETIYRDDPNKMPKDSSRKRASRTSPLTIAIPFIALIALAIVFTVRDVLIDGGDSSEKITAIHASDDYKGEDPETVRKELESLGFTNIQMIAQKPDLFDIFDLNEVENVTVNDALMTVNTKYKKDAPVKVTYYSFDTIGDESSVADSEQTPTPTPSPVTTTSVATNDQNTTVTADTTPIPTATPAAKEDVTKVSNEAENIQKSAFENESPIYLTTTKVKVRVEPNTECDVVDILESGTEITCIEEQSNGWSKVEYNGSTAYIKSEFLSKKEDSNEKTPSKGSTTPVDWCLNSTANSFISTYNRMYPDEQIKKDDVFVDGYTASYICLTDDIFVDIGESDNETVYQCFGFTKFSKENRSEFFEYANRIKKVTLGRFAVRESSGDYPVSDTYDNGVMVTSYDEYKTPQETHGKKYIMKLFAYPKTNY